jgi:hypothetical protein
MADRQGNQTFPGDPQELRLGLVLAQPWDTAATRAAGGARGAIRGQRCCCGLPSCCRWGKETRKPCLQLLPLHPRACCLIVLARLLRLLARHRWQKRAALMCRQRAHSAAGPTTCSRHRRFCGSG